MAGSALLCLVVISSSPLLLALGAPMGDSKISDVQKISKAHVEKQLATTIDGGRSGKENQAGIYTIGKSMATYSEPEERIVKGNNIVPGKSIVPSAVGFTAELERNMTNVRIGTTIKYNDAVYNKGNGYDNSTGVFTCPTSGIYLFSITAASFGETTLVIEILIDDVQYISTVSEPAKSGHDSTGTATLVIYVTEGQQVWVETAVSDNTNVWQSFNHFSGVLIQQF